MLLGYLQRQRDLVLWKLDGLSDHDANRVGTSSGLTIHGIVEHLTDVERSWVRRWFAGRRGLHIGGVDADHVAAARPDGARLRSWSTPTARRAGDATRSSPSTFARRRRGQRRASLRWIVHHLIEETSRHLGHLDLLRELADGRTGEAP